jgi:hypothetical protein
MRPVSVLLLYPQRDVNAIQPFFFNDDAINQSCCAIRLRESGQIS